MGELPKGELSVSVVSLAELELGVHQARDAETRALRLASLNQVRERYLAVPIDERVTSAFASLTAYLRQTGARAPVQDTWIAATALVHDAAVCTRDSDFDPLEGVQGLTLFRL